MTAELYRWWLDEAQKDAKIAAAKADEYGSYDLVLIGKVLADLLGFPTTPGESEDETYAELGVMFYALGKVARWVGAVKEGRRPSDDTIRDAKIYATMVERIRSVGGWPNESDSMSTLALRAEVDRLRQTLATLQQRMDGSGRINA